MFTEKAQALVDLAKDLAFAKESPDLTLSALLRAMADGPESCVLLAECLGLSPERLRLASPEYPAPAPCPGKLPLAVGTRDMLERAKELAVEVPDRSRPGRIGIRHLACAMANSKEACALLGAIPVSWEDTVRLLSSWHEKEAGTEPLEELTERLRRMRSELLSKVFGQDHAVQAFVEGLFNAEIVAPADAKRRAPRAVFIFAGPPGVGKTYLGELGASLLDRPFKRFDMSAFSGHQQNEAMVGVSRSYHGSHPGTLTEYVEKNPSAVLLFDEIEKAHLNTIHLFLQILDAGVLEDKYHERDVSFQGTTIIFTTNAGRKLYDRPNASGVHAANAAFHRQTILDALESERDPRTGEPAFPPTICSRLSTGYPVLFNHLRVNELERVVRSELNRVAGLLERQYFKRIEMDDFLPMCLVLREGARADARTLRAQAETFLKGEIFNFCQLLKAERIEEVLARAETIRFGLEGGPGELALEVRGLFEPPERPRVLLAAEAGLAGLYQEAIGEIDWRTASTAEEALEVLAREEVDMILLDLWLGGTSRSWSGTGSPFDQVPAAARGLDQGQELLRKIRDRLPAAPVYLLSLVPGEEENGRGSIGEELFLACVRGGGARGLLASRFVDGRVPGWEARRDAFAEALAGTCRRLHAERAAARLGQERKVLAFDTVPRIEGGGRRIEVRLRNLRLARAIAAADAGELLEDVERPTTRFDDVIGAGAAKEELGFFVDFLRNPKRFAALGLKPPKGVLLHGAPGTGKTMLARAMAGESNVAFIPVSAAHFVTIWQGSGPQNIRDLFARARRYAPSIIFIDEIDAVGRTRTGAPGAGQAEEITLNALLAEMDGFTSPSPDRPVFILAATNFKVSAGGQDPPGEERRAIDPALVRRFSRTILVELPEKAAREEYLLKRLMGRPACLVSREAVAAVAERSSGMSIANLEAVIEAASRSAARGDGRLDDRRLEEAFEAARFGEARASTPEARLRTARHEAGHALLYWHSGWWPSYVTVVPHGAHGGYMAPCSEEVERRVSRTRGEVLSGIRTDLGGRGAELLFYGREAGLSTGAAQDLESATETARAMVSRYGMDEEFGLVVTPELRRYEGALSSPVFLKINEAANRILREQMAEALRLLEEHRGLLEAVAGALVERERLTAEELKGILPGKAATA